MRWEAADTVLGHGDAVCAAEFSSDGLGLVTGSADGTAVVWQLADNDTESDESDASDASRTPGAAERWLQEARLGRTGGAAVRDVSFDPDGSQVLTADRDGSAQLWRRSSEPVVDANDESDADPAGGDEITFEGCFHESQFAVKTYYGNEAGVLFSRMVDQTVADERTLFAVGRHELELGHAYTILRTVGTPQYGTAACGTPCSDEPSRWCGCVNNDLGGYPNGDCPSGTRMMAVYKLHPNFLRARLGGNVTVPLVVPRFMRPPPAWELRSVLYGQGDLTWASHWPVGGSAKVAAGAADRTACIWRGDAKISDLVRDFVPLTSCLSGGAGGRISDGSIGRARGSTVMTASYPRSGSIWENPALSEVAPWTLFAYLEERPHLVTSVLWSPDGKRLLTGGSDGVARVWQLGGPDVHGSGRPRWDVVSSFRVHAGAVWTLAWSPDSGRVLTGSKEGDMFIWRPLARNPSRWEEPVSLDKLSGEAPSDITAGVDASAESSGVKGYAWDWLAVLNQKSNMDWVSPWAPAVVAAWSPDGFTVATGHRDGTARLWQESVADVKQWQVVATLRGHVGTIWTVSWSSDSRRLVTGGHDGAARIWRLRGEDGGVAEAAPDGNVASTRDATSCDFVRYEGHTCAGGGGALFDMVEAYEGTLEACRRQCCSMGEACAGFELEGGAAGAPGAGTTLDRATEVDGADWAEVRGRCYFRAAVLQAPLDAGAAGPPRDCFRHARKSDSESHLRHYHALPHAHKQPL